VASGRITADLAPQYTELATANLSACSAILSTLPARKSVITTITAQTGTDGTPAVGRVTAAASMAEISANTKPKQPGS
jgi:hypothetical protein